MKTPTLISWNFAQNSTSSNEIIDVHFKNEEGVWCYSTFHVDYDSKITLRPVGLIDDIDEEIAAEVIDDLRRYNSYGYAKTEHFKESP